MAELTPKQEKFCLAYIETGNASEAYRQAYNAEKMKPAVISVKASELLANGKIAVRVSELREPAAKMAQVTLEGHLQRLDALSRGAEAEGQFSAAISAEIARGKAAGVHIEKNQTEHTINPFRATVDDFV